LPMSQCNIQHTPHLLEHVRWESKNRWAAVGGGAALVGLLVWRRRFR
jgi:hypothetical protein